MEQMLVTPQLMETAPLKVKFLTAAYDMNVDNYLQEELDKFLIGDLTKVRAYTSAPAIFVSASKDILIAAPYKEITLEQKHLLDRIHGMEEEELQMFPNWEKVIRDLQDKGVKIGYK